MNPTDDERVTILLGRRPMGAYEVVVRRADGDPVVLCNEPLLPDGTPMPTRYWLCDPDLRSVIGTIESEGAIDMVEEALGLEVIAVIHDAHAAARDAALPAGLRGPRPSGGVGGTRVGVKCLHAHYAHWLAGGDDPVGEWTHRRLLEKGLLPADAPTRIRR